MTTSSDFEVNKRYALRLADDRSIDGIVTDVQKESLTITNIEDNQSVSVLRKDITEAAAFTVGARYRYGDGASWLGNAGNNIPVGSGSGGAHTATETNGIVSGGRQYHVVGCTCGKCYGKGEWVE